MYNCCNAHQQISSWNSNIWWRENTNKAGLELSWNGWYIFIYGILAAWLSGHTSNRVRKIFVDCITLLLFSHSLLLFIMLFVISIQWTIEVHFRESRGATSCSTSCLCKVCHIRPWGTVQIGVWYVFVCLSKLVEPLALANILVSLFFLFAGRS